MKNNKTLETIILFILGMSVLAGMFSCTKEAIGQPSPQFQAVTFIFKETKDTIIHWHRVGGDDLQRFKSYPRESVIYPGCDDRIQVLIIGEDKCNFKN